MIAGNSHDAKSVQPIEGCDMAAIIKFPVDRIRKRGRPRINPDWGASEMLDTPHSTGEQPPPQPLLRYLALGTPAGDLDPAIAADVQVAMSNWVRLADRLMKPFFIADYLARELQAGTPLEAIEAIVLHQHLKAVERLVIGLQFVELDRAHLRHSLRTLGRSHGC